MTKGYKSTIVVVTMAPFPKGNVSTLRYSSYLKVLAKQGFSSNVIIYCPTSMAKDQRERFGEVDNIHFCYSTRTTWRRGNLIEKIVFSIVGVLKSSYYLYKLKPNSIVLYGDNNISIVLWGYLVSKFLRAKYVCDRSELPSISIRKSWWRLKLYEQKQKLFDGIMVMTKQLTSYYSKFSKSNDFVFFMPMTIDICRFDNVITCKQNYIAVVFGTHNRDGLDKTLKVFAYYKNELKGSYKLVLIGDYNQMPNKVELDNIIDSMNLRNQIDIKGLVPIDKVPELLSNASCLITTPKEYISGGFPTKLGEYMLSGTPVVATAAGEILDYIEPNKDIFICNYEDEKELAQSIIEIESNSMIANMLSENAKKKAQKFFNAENYVEGLIKFLIY